MNTLFRLILVILIALAGTACRHSEREEDHQPVTPTKVVYIQPLGDVKQEYIGAVSDAIRDFYGFSCEIRPVREPTPALLAASGTRYDANKILTTCNSDDYVLVLTELHFAARKGKYQEWGVFGLGYLPGKVCAVSTYRFSKGVSHEKVVERLKKIALHELGHNLGLPHCDQSPWCLMNDAKGTVKTVDRCRMELCDDCWGKIKR